jgi:hypothetical protein
MAAEGDVGEVLGKRVLALFISIGVLILWIGLILAALGDRTVGGFGRILGFTGALFAFVVALAGALGSKRTSDFQNLGLLIIAAALIVASVQLLP